MTVIKLRKIRYSLGQSTSLVYGYILGFYEQNQYMPAVSEIAEAFSKSKMWAWLMLKELHRQRKIKVSPKKHRGIVLIERKKVWKLG